MDNKEPNLDEILKSLGGFGKYQRRRWILLCFAIWSFAQVEFSYIFTTDNPKYRCRISICDDNVSYPEYNPKWLSNAIPFKVNEPLKCEHFRIVNENSDTCSAHNFLSNRTTVQCNDFVFENNHTSIANDFNIFCNEKLWMLTLPSTLHFIALLCGLPITGLLSDRFGRKNILVYGCILAGLFNIIKSFSPSYWYYIIFEFIQGLLGSGVFTSFFTLSMEVTETKKRVYASCAVFVFAGLAQATLGTVAWNVYSWRMVLRYTSIANLLIIFYSSFIPESLRWLIAKGKFQQVNQILKIIAAENGKKLLKKDLLTIKADQTGDSEKNSNINGEKLGDVFRNFAMIIRIITCTFCWITCAFVFYGLLLSSGHITGNRYLNFILVALIELPANLITCLSCSRIGRKRTLSGALITAGLCCGAFIFVKNGHWLQLVFFLLGKASITTSFGSLYFVTAEMYPTPFRQTLMGTCSMVGRIGAILAPQMPHLANIWKSLPLLIFSLVSIVSGLLSLTFPETLNTELPDTIAKALNIGKDGDKNCTKL